MRSSYAAHQLGLARKRTSIFTKMLSPYDNVFVKIDLLFFRLALYCYNTYVAGQPDKTLLSR